jgi:hypothetical protein
LIVIVDDVRILLDKIPRKIDIKMKRIKRTIKSIGKTPTPKRKKTLKYK